MGEGGRGGKGAKSGQARSACPRVKTRRDGREPVLAVTWRPFPGSCRGRHAGAVAASPAVTDELPKRGVIRTGAECAGAVDAAGVLQSSLVATFHPESLLQN